VACSTAPDAPPRVGAAAVAVCTVTARPANHHQAPPAASASSSAMPPAIQGQRGVRPPSSSRSSCAMRSSFNRFASISRASGSRGGLHQRPPRRSGWGRTERAD